MSRLIVTLVLAMAISGCSALRPAASGPIESAVVTGVANGSAKIPAERLYILRTSGGRMVTTTQALKLPLKEGDKVEIERGADGSVHIREP